ncbi:MAG: hypothetical protein ACXWWS_12365, partial [Candidatus Deferrimicrobiaceae bacterium]
LEKLEKERALGEAADLGCPRIETPTAGKTTVPGGGQTATDPTAIPRGPATALTATTPGVCTTIETSKGKTRKRARKT